ncbi:sensor histidine kinase [Clostridium saccharoperbutylacetonicum]|jgi:two-component system phosphate regulon sensor histidine kinase PhoR|uniref:histidine kinase n=1 Tax=Clostridium saccharoperbutylacetonicum N1-4(HMT) TaxID=931276 RepID=M1MU09_9CLOT|nr:ATP-binding protein [Clostridium saccharoperbutylacetonicum]AGF55037.1 alkaline phosphatase synthesis sensor protein PhoR [Clostridium saccharoperbutylacetonicum N1-4(HMT)]NRT64254.1 two-component system phosphate regulon sensor histidine kinase PhoR [Clostridium saccharoperbutylacetonicum]NSB27622.1 two-component system phosphate regulon sensor histidine kinase PhoR [Clostridium saccharoperbutylacetonicum]NSB41110.1 two-component system phosphate regulon sensor histidine kinase PhoR [Clostr
MKNKILTSVMITVLFAIIIVVSSFMIITNLEQEKFTTEELRNINYLVSELNNVTDISNNNYEAIRELNTTKINGIDVRFTLIDNNGVVLYDNEQLSGENHKDRVEVKEALANGQGYSKRYSDTIKAYLIYYATKLKNNYVIRSSVSINTITLLQKENIKYCLGILALVIPFSVFLSLRLVKKIVDPVKELESVTLKMAHGDYEIRADINTNDELGTLGNSFNNMAEQLQLKIHEVIDNQNKIESIFKSMESGVIAVDNHDNVISINPCAESLLGIRKNIVGQCLLDYVNDYDINKFLQEEGESDKEIKILHPIERDFKIKKSEMFDGAENIGKVITFQDITDINRVELMRRQFVANVSHELKTPLTSIKGFAETLKFVKDDETREKFLDIIDKEAERLSRLINDILVLSKIESNLTIDMEEFEPRIVIEEVLNIMRKIAVNKNIKLEFKDTSDKKVLGNRDKFHQLVLNLVENAIKYSKDDSGKVEVFSYDKDEYYCLIVKDNGVGIPKEDIPRIFERFYRVDKSRKKGGTGLGLAIVKHIVKLFNGEINVKSEVGEGTSFEVKIPDI